MKLNPDQAEDIERENDPKNQDEIDRAIGTINAPYSERTIRTFQTAITSTDNPIEQAQEILRVIDDLGLEPESSIGGVRRPLAWFCGVGAGSGEVVGPLLREASAAVEHVASGVGAFGLVAHGVG